MLSNLYIVPLMLGEDYEMIDMWHGSNTEEPEWAEMTPRAFLGLWTDGEKAWAREVYHGDEFASVRERWIDIHRKLEDAPLGAERTRLCEQARRAEEGEAFNRASPRPPLREAFESGDIARDERFLVGAGPALHLRLAAAGGDEGGVLLGVRQRNGRIETRGATCLAFDVFLVAAVQVSRGAWIQHAGLQSE